MKEYIDKKNAINLLWLFADETCASVVWDFENLPAEDIVEVVRCKDCKWFVYDMDLNHETYPNAIEADGLCQIADKYCDMLHFCSYGERREENGES